MNFRIVPLVAVLALCACRKDASPVVDAGAAAPSVGAKQQPEVVAEKPKPPGPCLDLVRSDAGVDATEFTGFAADGSRFAFSVMSEGAGGVVMTVIDPPSKLVKKFLLDTPEAKAQAAAFLADGGFTRDRRRADFDVVVREGAAVVSRKDGAQVFTGTPFEGARGSNTHAGLWGCDPSGQRAALEVSTQFESEYGNARAFVVFDVNGGN